MRMVLWVQGAGQQELRLTVGQRVSTGQLGCAESSAVPKGPSDPPRKPHTCAPCPKLSASTSVSEAPFESRGAGSNALNVLQQ